MPMVAVAVRRVFGWPGVNTDSTAPVTTRMPVSSRPPVAPSASTRELARISTASLPVTKSTSPFEPVVITSPALMSMPSLAGAPLTRTSPRMRWTPFSTVPAASTPRSQPICSASAVAAPARR
jgi:hypothetical protein